MRGGGAGLESMAAVLLDTVSLLWDVVWHSHGAKSDRWHWVVRDPLDGQEQCLMTIPSARG